jgi:hypothetical protein
MLHTGLCSRTDLNIIFGPGPTDHSHCDKAGYEYGRERGIGREPAIKGPLLF